MWKCVIFLSMFSCALGMSISARTITNSTEQVSFSVYATNLSKCSLILGCDTSVNVLCSSINSDWKVCDKTRRIRNNNNPVWPKVFTFDHVPGSRQRWRIDLMEHKLVGSQRMGSFMINVDEFVDKTQELLDYQLPNDRGSLWVRRTNNAAS